jgi:DNA integrity scanning protein DisA with diadenylate cyclase activity/ribosomal protein L40E
MGSYMSNKRKYNNNAIGRLHNVLNSKHSKTYESNDKKYLESLNKRLKKISEEDTKYQKISYKEKDISKDDLLKPKVTIHFREEKKVIEKPKIIEELPVIEVETKKSYEDEDIFEVQKVIPPPTTFIEVKPKIVEEKEKEIESKTEVQEEFTEWEPVLEEKKETEKTDDQFCSECGTKLIPDARFCLKCGFQFKQDKTIIANNEKPETVSAETKTEEEKEIEPKWEPVDFTEEKVEIEKIELNETAVGEISKEQVESIKEVIPNDDKIDAFKEIKSIDDATAILLYDNGYTKIETLKNVPIKDLIKIKGIKKKQAKDIKKEVDRFFKEPVKIAPIKTEDLIKKEIKKEQFIPIDSGTSSDEWEPVEIIEEEKEEEQKEKKITKKKKDLSGHPHEKELSPEENHMVDEKIIEYEQIVEKIPLRAEKSEVLIENNIFKDINSIDERIAFLLRENNINSIDELKDITVKELIKIKGIRRKVAKTIKKEVSQYFEKKQQVVLPKPKIKEKKITKTTDEWEIIEEKKSDDADLEEIEGFKHGDYILYEKTIQTKSGKTQIIRFFSKGEPEECTPIDLPEGYEVKENTKTGVPYLRKKV